MLKKLLGKTQEETNEITELIAEIRNCEFLMTRNDVFFNMTEDEDLIEAHIYEREALRYQYNYLIKQLKEKETYKEHIMQTVKTGD